MKGASFTSISIPGKITNGIRKEWREKNLFAIAQQSMNVCLVSCHFYLLPNPFMVGRRGERNRQHAHVQHETFDTRPTDCRPATYRNFQGCTPFYFRFSLQVNKCRHFYNKWVVALKDRRLDGHTWARRTGGNNINILWLLNYLLHETFSVSFRELLQPKENCNVAEKNKSCYKKTLCWRVIKWFKWGWHKRYNSNCVPKIGQ